MPELKKSLATTLYILSVFVLPFFTTVPVQAESATPVYEWTAYLEATAGVGPDITDIATAPDGSVYAIGDLYGTVDFNPEGAGDSFTMASGSHVFITKRSNSGSYEWTRVIGDPADSSFTGAFPEVIAKTDAAGNIYLWGIFDGNVNFNPTGSDVRTALSNSDEFVTKWNADGTYGWTHTFGAPAVPSPNYDSITAIEVTASGDTYVGGDFSGPTDFNAYGAGDVKTTVGGGSDRDAYITKINSDGSYGWTQTFGGTANDFVDINGILELGDGSGIFVPVSFESPSIDADPGAGTTTISQVGCCDMIAMIKLDTSGNLIWALPFGNNSYTDIDHMVSDTSGAIYAQGEFGGTLDFDPGPGVESVTAVGSSGGYVLKLNPDGTHNWSSQFIGVIENNALRLGDDGVYASITYSNGSDWLLEGNTITDVGSFDSLVSKWDFDGNFEWYRSIGSDEYDYGYDFSVNATCDAIYTLSDIYPSPAATINFDPNGSDNRLIPDTGAFYITRYSTLGQYTWTSIVDTAVDLFYLDNTAIGPNDSIYFAGEAEGSAIDFDDTGGSDIINSGGIAPAGVISKLSNSAYRQHVVNLDGAVNAVESGSGDNAKLGNTGVTRTSSTDIRVGDATDGLAVAEIDTDLSCDRNWSGVDADSDATAGTAFVSGLTAAEGTDATLDLLVPKLTDSNGVGVCPGATSLTGLDESCGGYYELTDGDAGLAEATVGGDDYWRVLGVSDSGGFNTLGAATSLAEETLAPTGSSALLSIVYGLALAGAVWRVTTYRAKYRHPAFYRSK